MGLCILVQSSAMQRNKPGIETRQTKVWLLQPLKTCVITKNFLICWDPVFPAMLSLHVTLFSHKVATKWRACFERVVMKLQFSSIAQSCPTLCNPMDCSVPGVPVHHQFQELIQIHVHRVGDAIQPSHPLSSPSPPAFNLSQHRGLF